jgi:hypothetical protein
MKRTLYAILAVLLTAVSASAQAPTLIQQGATQLTACTTGNANGAVNATATLTLTPPNGQFVYISEIDMQVANDATGAVVSTNLKFTSTNIGGWQFQFSAANAANTSTNYGPFIFGPPIKSAAAGTAVTIVSPAANTHAAYSINACYYFAP